MKPTLMVHPLHGHKHAYHADEVAADVVNGWAVAEEAPAAVVAVETFAVGVPQEEAVDERAALRAELDAKGVTYDARWGVKRLREALA